MLSSRPRNQPDRGIRDPGSYYLLAAVKGALLTKTGEIEGAAGAFREALVRRCTEPERRFLERRLSECAATSAPHPEGNRVLGGA